MADAAKKTQDRRKRVLVVDDDDLLRTSIGRILEINGFSVAFGRNHEEALTQAAETRPEHAVIDLMLGEASGLDLIVALREKYPDLRIILVTGFGSISTAVDAIRLGAADYLLKPVDPDELIQAMDSAKPREASKEKPDIPTLERAQWEYIHRVLGQCDGNISEAARRLGLHRQSLQRMLKRHPPRK